jgi:hypothetical protein
MGPLNLIISRIWNICCSVSSPNFSFISSFSSSESGIFDLSIEGGRAAVLQISNTKTQQKLVFHYYICIPYSFVFDCNKTRELTKELKDRMYVDEE